MFANVIDSNGFKVVFTLLNDDGTTKFYELKDGEEIIEKDWDIANTMNKPKWNGSSWVDKEPLPIIPPVSPQPTEVDLMKQELVNVQEALDFIVMNGGI